VRIYEGTPRQDWEEVLRCVGAFADEEGLKEILLLERPEGLVLQGLRFDGGGAMSDALGTLTKRTYELNDEAIAELMEVRYARRGSGAPGDHRDITNYYEMALRLLGRYIDGQRPHDVFLFEQEGAFVLRLYGVAGSHAGSHSLAEFTRDEMLAMITEARQQFR
jgi:hypothetical protein